MLLFRLKRYIKIICYECPFVFVSYLNLKRIFKIVKAYSSNIYTIKNRLFRIHYESDSKFTYKIKCYHHLYFKLELQFTEKNCTIIIRKNNYIGEYKYYSDTGVRETLRETKFTLSSTQYKIIHIKYDWEVGTKYKRTAVGCVVKMENKPSHLIVTNIYQIFGTYPEFYYDMILSEYRQLITRSILKLVTNTLEYGLLHTYYLYYNSNKLDKIMFDKNSLLVNLVYYLPKKSIK